MTDAYVLTVIALLCLCSILTRCGYLVFGHRFPLSDRVRRTLRYAPVAALVAIIIPELLPLSASPTALINPRLLAGVAAVVLFVRTRNAMAVIVGGMLALWAFRLLFSV